MPVDEGITVMAVGTTRLTVDTASWREADEDFVPEDELVVAGPDLVVRTEAVTEAVVWLEVEVEKVAVADDVVVVSIAASVVAERNPVTVVTGTLAL